MLMGLGNHRERYQASDFNPAAGLLSSNLPCLVQAFEPEVRQARQVVVGYAAITGKAGQSRTS